MQGARLSDAQRLVLNPAARAHTLPLLISDPCPWRSYGYDPLGLSAKGGKEDVDKYRAYELIHARWAMLGALGAIVPEGINAFGGSDIPGAVWWQVRALGTDIVRFSGRGRPGCGLHTPSALRLPARLSAAP